MKRWSAVLVLAFAAAAPVVLGGAPRPALPAWLQPIPGSTVGRPYRVVVNGEASSFVNGVAEHTLDQVVRHYLDACRGRSVLADLPAAEQEERGLVDGIRMQETDAAVVLGFVDREGRTAGIVAFRDPDPQARRTQYYLTCSEGKSPLAPAEETGDAPGRDPAGIARAPGLRRAFAMEREDDGSSTHVFTGAVDPRAMTQRYRATLLAAGWREDATIADAFPGGNLMAFAKDDRTCRVQIAQEAGDGAVSVTILVQRR